MSEFNEKYKGVVFKGSEFPDDPILYHKPIHLNSHIQKEYLPLMNHLFENDPYGLRLLSTIMTHCEGFYPGSRSYNNHNPGNIGNVDSGLNKHIETLAEGILAQKNFFLKVVSGNNHAFPINKRVLLPSRYSKEIANHPSYGLPAWLPGYDFIYTGQLDQFIKIYATAPRANNHYPSSIISFFVAHGFDINEKTKIQDIIKMEAK